MRLTLTFYYLVKRKIITRERREKNIIEINKTEMNVLYYPMVYYANTIQPKLTMQTEFNLDYEMEKKKQLPYARATVPGVRCRCRCHMGGLPLSKKK